MVTYIINKSPTKILKNKTSAELWYAEKPNMQKLKVFGCAAYLRQPDKLIKSNLEIRTLKCVMMVFCPNEYKFWGVEQQKVLNGHGPGSETQKHVEIQKSRDF